MLDVAALDPVGQVPRTEQGGGGDQDGAELDAGEHHLPQRRDVAEHEEHPVAAVDALGPQPGRELRRPGGQVGVGQQVLGAVRVDDPERQGLGLLGGQHVEPVEAEVEVLELGPPELR